MAKKTTVTITCDQCTHSIDLDNMHRFYKPSVAFESDGGLKFYDWTDELADEPGAIHLHSDSCATTFLCEWLRLQRGPKEIPLPIPVPAPNVTWPSDEPTVGDDNAVPI